MTNQEIIEMQRRYKRLSELSKTIGAELSASSDPLMKDAAEVIRFQQEEIARLNQELKDLDREAQRSARDAYAQGEQDEYDRSREGR